MVGCIKGMMLSLFKANKPKKNIRKTDLLPGQYLDQGLSWEDQII